MCVMMKSPVNDYSYAQRECSQAGLDSELSRRDTGCLVCGGRNGRGRNNRLRAARTPHGELCVVAGAL